MLGVLRLEFSEAAVYQSLRSTVLRGIGVAAVAVVVGSLLAFAASGLITRPIRQLTASAGPDRLGRHDSSDRRQPRRRDRGTGGRVSDHDGELKRTFGDLVREKRRTEAIVQSRPDGMVAVDAGRRVTFMNPAALSVLGFGRRGPRASVRGDPRESALRGRLLLAGGTARPGLGARRWALSPRQDGRSE